MRFLALVLAFMGLIGCAAFRVENPNLARPVADPNRAELVGWKSDYQSISGPDRVIPVAVDGVDVESKDLDPSETIHSLPPGRRNVSVMYFGARGNVVPRNFAGVANIPLRAEPGVRYQCRGRMDGKDAVLFIVQWPSGERATGEMKATMLDMSMTGEWKLRGDSPVRR